MRCGVVIWLMLAVGLALLPAGAADAKITCARGQAAATGVELEGLPRSPVAATTYKVTLDLPRGTAVNPEPVVQILRCPADRNRGDLVDVDSSPVSGVDTGAGDYAFPVRFARAGRWRMVAFDRSGMFHDFGFLNVSRPVASSALAEDDDELAPILIALATLSAGALAVLAARRRRAKQEDAAPA